jgi:hypothetical protein
MQALQTLSSPQRWSAQSEPSFIVSRLIVMATLLVLGMRAKMNLALAEDAGPSLMQAFEQGCARETWRARGRIRFGHVGVLPWIADPCLCHTLGDVCCCAIVRCSARQPLTWKEADDEAQR